MKHMKRHEISEKQWNGKISLQPLIEQDLVDETTFMPDSTTTK